MKTSPTMMTMLMDLQKNTASDDNSFDVDTFVAADIDADPPYVDVMSHSR